MFSTKSKGRRSHTSSFIYPLGRTACDLAALTYLALAIVFPVQSLRITLIDSAWAQFPGQSGQHNQKPEDCPEGLGPPQNCNDIERMAAALADKRGWGTVGGRAAFRSRGYQVNVHDCTTGNAQMGCLINDPCMAQYGEMKMLRSQSAWHATSYWQGANGQSFECDFTPGTGYGGGRGNLIGHLGDARIGTSTIDSGESPDPNYALNNCPSAGSGNYSALNPFGGAGGSGGMSSMMSMMMLMMLLQSLQQQNQQQQNQQPPPVAPIDIVPTATPTPTPTPAPKVKISAGALSDSELVGGGSLKPEVVVQSSNLDLPTSVSTDGSKSKKGAEWEDPRGSMF